MGDNNGRLLTCYGEGIHQKMQTAFMQKWKSPGRKIQLFVCYAEKIRNALLDLPRPLRADPAPKRGQKESHTIMDDRLVIHQEDVIPDLLA